MRQIFPVPAGHGGDPGSPNGPGDLDSVAGLAALYDYPAGDRPWLRANMITSVDGGVSVQGRSGGLSGPADRLLFTVLRSLADVILVGAGTARAERYRQALPRDSWPELRAGRVATPPIAVLTSRLDLDLEGPLFSGGLTQTIVLTTLAAPARRRQAAAEVANVIELGAVDVTAADVIGALAGLGHRRILTEGGPTLLGQIVADGLLDELCLTISPVLEGGHCGRIIAAPATRPADLACLTLASMLEQDGTLLGRYLRAS